MNEFALLRLAIYFFFGLASTYIGNGTLIMVTILRWKSKPFRIKQWWYLMAAVIVNWVWVFWTRFALLNPPTIQVYAFFFLAAIFLPIWAWVALEQKLLKE
jgi:hypothetical protein